MDFLEYQYRRVSKDWGWHRWQGFSIFCSDFGQGTGYFVKASQVESTCIPVDIVVSCTRNNVNWKLESNLFKYLKQVYLRLKKIFIVITIVLHTLFHIAKIPLFSNNRIICVSVSKEVTLSEFYTVCRVGKENPSWTIQAIISTFIEER